MNATNLTTDTHNASLIHGSASQAGVRASAGPRSTLFTLLLLCGVGLISTGCLPDELDPSVVIDDKPTVSVEESVEPRPAPRPDPEPELAPETEVEPEPMSFPGAEVDPNAELDAESGGTFSSAVDLESGTGRETELVTPVELTQGMGPDYDEDPVSTTETETTPAPSADEPLEVIIEADALTGHVDEELFFTALPSTESIVEYAWDLGDGTISTGDDNTASHAYPENGLYAITLTVTDDQGQTATASLEIEVRPYWVYAVYMAADNNLAYFGLLDMMEMEKTPATPYVQVVVQAEFGEEYLRTQEGYVPANEFGLTTYETSRFLVQSDETPNEMIDSSQEVIGDRDMGSGQALSEFITWVQAEFPADHTALVIWNHGGGWQGVCGDDTAESFMGLADLGDALDQSSASFDVIDFDACLMAMYETAYVVHGHCGFMVASEETEPGDGNPYTLILGELADNPGYTPLEMAQSTCRNFRESYVGPPHAGEKSATKSALDMAFYVEVDEAVGAFAASLIEALETEREAVQEARDEAQHYQLKGSCDLIDFAARIVDGVSDTDLATEAADLAALVTDAIVANEFLSGTRSSGDAEAPDVDNSHGLAIMIPRGDDFSDEGSATFQNYHDFAGTQHPNWVQFVEALISGQEEPYEASAGDFGVAIMWADPSVDIDLYVAEPTEWASPWMGTTSTNGYLSGDSADTGEPIELWAAQDHVMAGSYHIFVNLYDPGLCDYVEVDVYYYDGDCGYTDWTYLTTVALTPYGPAPVNWWEYESEIEAVLMGWYSDWTMVGSFER